MNIGYMSKYNLTLSFDQQSVKLAWSYTAVWLVWLKVQDEGRERRGITSDQYQNQYHEYKFIHDPSSNKTTSTPIPNHQ